MMDRDWFPSAALFLLQEQLRTGTSVPEVEVARLWGIPRVAVANGVKYLRSVGFVISVVTEARLTPSGTVQTLDSVSYYIGSLYETDTCCGPSAPSGQEEDRGAMPLVRLSAQQATERQELRRRGQGIPGL